jgi:ribonuclease R
MPESMAAPSAGPGKGGKPQSEGARRKGPRGGNDNNNGPRPFERRGRGAPRVVVPAQGVGQAGFTDPHAAREAERYAQPIASREVILGTLSASEGPLTSEEVAAKLDLTAPERYEALTKRLNAMVRDGQLLLNRRGGYAPAEQMDLVKGVVIANPEGFGFLRAEAGGDDLFLPPFEMRKVMHGDRVLASITGVDRRGRSEGAIVEVLERRVNRLIGRFAMESGVSFVVPDDKRMQRNIMVPPDARNEARDGQLVVLELTHAPDGRRDPIGKIVAVLGDKLTPSLVVETAIHGHELPYEFPPEVLAEASAVPLSVEPSMIGGRWSPSTAPIPRTSTTRSIANPTGRACASATARAIAWWWPSPMCPTTCGPARRWTTKRRSARPRCTSPGSWCRCCRRPSPTASARSIPTSTACASSATCRWTRTARSATPNSMKP